MTKPKSEIIIGQKELLDAAKKKMQHDILEKVRIDVASLQPNDGPSADPKRAAEIAGMSAFGFLEFFELTGVAEGKYGTFIVSEKNVLPSVNSNQTEWTATQRIDIKKATIGQDLAFPCTPDEFADWHKCTCGTNGVSDFTVAQGFFKALGRATRPSAIHGDIAVASDAIIAAFKVNPDEVINRTWWDERLRGAKNYEGLLDARVRAGAGNRKSTWFPRLVGLWLMEKNHMNRSNVTAAIKKYFPDCDTEWL